MIGWKGRCPLFAVGFIAFVNLTLLHLQANSAKSITVQFVIMTRYKLLEEENPNFQTNAPPHADGRPGSEYPPAMLTLKALEDCCCIVIGCLSCGMGDVVSLYKNDDTVVH